MELVRYVSARVAEDIGNAVFIYVRIGFAEAMEE